MTTYYIWPLNNVVTYKLILQNYECPVCYVYIDLVDIKSKTVFPVMVTYALISPELLPRDIYCSYKALWTLKGNDDVAQKITYRMNNEFPGLERQLKEFFGTGIPYFYENEEIINERGKKTKIKVEQTLHNPLIICNPPDNQNQTTTLLFFSQFLASETKLFAGLNKPQKP